MARNYRFSATDLIALSGVPRAFEIFDETLDGEVRSELEEFTGNRVRRETQGLNCVRSHGRYVIVAPLHGERDLICFVGYETRSPDGYPAAIVALEARPGAMGRDASVAAMKRMVLRKGWTDLNLDNPAKWAGAWRRISLTSLLPEEDHLAAVKCFFIESLRELRLELTVFKKERPDSPWTGG